MASVLDKARAAVRDACVAQGGARRVMDLIEYTTAREDFRDFCLWEYKPRVPHENKLRSASLLFQSFQTAGADARMFEIVRMIREGIGMSRTVWGVKRLGRDIRWEFYFYDYARRARVVSVAKVLRLIGSLAPCALMVNENLPYFMFSLDVDGELVSGARELDEIHLYFGNPGSAVSSGICYSLKADGTRLENFYFFFDAKGQGDAIASKVACSAYFDTCALNPALILWPEMGGCEVIVVANKQQNDAVYFSRITIDQLIFFLKRLHYPGELVSFIEENKPLLDHLLYDVGFDYRMEGDNLVILKSGYYGVF
jgi:hypothetical protein